MACTIRGPDDAYAVRIEAFVSGRSGAVRRYTIDVGLPVAGITVADGQARPSLEEPLGECRRFLVRVGPQLSFILEPLEAGLVTHCGSLLGGGRATVVARVEAEPGAPEWLPECATYVILDGDTTDIAEADGHYTPFRRCAAEARPGRVVAADRLILALGRSVARANDRLAVRQSAGGVALVSSVHIRVGVLDYEVAGQDRVILALPEPGQIATQHLEVTMRTVPSVNDEGAHDPESDK